MPRSNSDQAMYVPNILTLAAHSLVVINHANAFLPSRIGFIKKSSNGILRLLPPKATSRPIQKNIPFDELKVALNANENQATENDSKKRKNNDEASQNLVHFEAIASAGLGEEELQLVLGGIESAAESFGLEFVVTHKFYAHAYEAPAVPESVPGAMGRVVLLSLNNVASDWTDDDERLFPFTSAIAGQIDTLIPQIHQPVLVSLKPSFEVDLGESDSNLKSLLCDVVTNEVSMYDLRLPLDNSNADYDSNYDDDSNDDDSSSVAVVPQAQTCIEIDGAMIPDAYTGEEGWDMSSILVFDDFVDSSLRERLLDIILKRDVNDDSDLFDDKNLGPDPRRWERGGLDDTPADADADTDTDIEEGAVADEDAASCWGLRDEAVEELCYEYHPAIAEVEKKVCSIFPDYDVARLPTAMYSCISPLTANAPTYGDSFSYHIDADPYAAPPCKYGI